MPSRAFYDTPLTEQMRARMKERNLSFRDLSQLTRAIAAYKDEQGLGRSYLGNIAQAREHPNRRAISLIAEALDLNPKSIPEYRLACLLERLNPKQHADATTAFLQLEEQLLDSGGRDPVSELIRTLASQAHEQRAR